MPKINITLKNKILPAYKKLWGGDFTIEFLYGTRDSGKSKFAHQSFVRDFLTTEKDFKGVLIRKVKDTIKDSLFAGVKNVLEEWKVAPYIKTTSNPMEIKTTINNNIIICRGLDEVGKIKSLTNPTHVIIEEGDQISADDFTTILTTLRHNTIKPKVYFLFNPELPKGITRKEDWWLYKVWFSHTSEKSFEHTRVLEYTLNGITEQVEIRYRATHTTFQDNPYCTPDRRAQYEDLKNTNPAKYLPYAKGEWGSLLNENPFFYSFVHESHYIDSKYPLDPSKPIDISFDFNKDPCTALLSQKSRSYNIFDVILENQKSYNGKSPLEAVCETIKLKYLDTGLVKNYYITITGDASGKSGSADKQDSDTYYSTIMRCLGVNASQIKLRQKNTTHIFSGELCNYALNKMPIFIWGVPELLADINRAYVDKDGTLNEAKEELGLHVVDAFRYQLDAWFGCHPSGQGFIKDIKIIKNNIDNLVLLYKNGSKT